MSHIEQLPCIEPAIESGVPNPFLFPEGHVDLLVSQDVPLDVEHEVIDTPAGIVPMAESAGAITVAMIVDKPIRHRFLTRGVERAIKTSRNIGDIVLTGLRALGDVYVGDSYKISSVEQPDIAQPLGKEDQGAQLSESLKDALRRMEQFGFARTTPRLIDLVSDTGRTNAITFSVNERSMATYSSGTKRRERQTMTESDALKGLRDFLDISAGNPALPVALRERASDIRDNLTFIGKKEYEEAVDAIAEFWKSKLRDNPRLHVFLVAGEISDKDGYNHKKFYKSDDWLLENVLSRFTDEDIVEFGDRLILKDTDVPTQIDNQDLSIVLLDDWSISGSQMNKVHLKVVKRFPRFTDCISVQLIVGSERMIRDGLYVWDRKITDVRKNVPVMAYFQAHPSRNALCKTRVTGFHSSVDFDFEHDIDMIVRSGRIFEDKHGNMPPLTNIVRPYRDRGYKETQRRRVEKIKRRAK